MRGDERLETNVIHTMGQLVNSHFEKKKLRRENYKLAYGLIKQELGKMLFIDVA